MTRAISSGRGVARPRRSTQTNTISASAMRASSATRRTTWRSVRLVVPRCTTVVSIRSTSRGYAPALYSITALRAAGQTPLRSNRSMPGPRASGPARAGGGPVAGAKPVHEVGGGGSGGGSAHASERAPRPPGQPRGPPAIGDERRSDAYTDHARGPAEPGDTEQQTGDG